MIDERFECENYLNGKMIDRKATYRMCFLLAKWYKEQGFQPAEIRNAIFSWASNYHVHIEQHLNTIIYKVIEDSHPLFHGAVSISSQDALEISNRFDKKNAQITALSLLCYAKVHADEDHEFQISLEALSHWIGINKTNISGRYLPELADFHYIIKKETAKNFAWNKKVLARNLLLHICVPFDKKGEFVLINNDIRALHNKIFV